MNDAVHPMFLAAVMNFCYEVAQYAAVARENGLSSEQAFRNIESDYLRRLVADMRIPEAFADIGPTESAAAGDFDLIDLDNREIPIGRSILEYRNGLYDRIGVIELAMVEKLGKGSNEIKFVDACLAAVMSGKAPSVEKFKNRGLWNDLLKNPTPVEFQGGTVELGDLFALALDTAAEFRRLNKWMHTMNRNGYGHEWKFLPDVGYREKRAENFTPVKK